MSYYNPRIYNYSNLTTQDQVQIDQMIHIYHVVDNSQDNYDVDDNVTYLEKIFNEIAQKVIIETTDLIYNEMVEFIVSRIDNYDFDVEEKDTDDYFYDINHS